MERRPEETMGRYIEVPADQLLTTVRAIAIKIVESGGHYNRLKAGDEVAYAITLPPKHGGCQIRVYTSLREGDDVVRGCGQDAVRLVFGTTAGGVGFKPLAKSRRVFRTAPRGTESERVAMFLARFTQALRDVYALAAKVPCCPKCEHHMALRKGGFGEFYGCISYPECTATREVAA